MCPSAARQGDAQTGGECTQTEWNIGGVCRHRRKNAGHAAANLEHYHSPLAPGCTRTSAGGLPPRLLSSSLQSRMQAGVGSVASGSPWMLVPAGVHAMELGAGEATPGLALHSLLPPPAVRPAEAAPAACDPITGAAGEAAMGLPYAGSSDMLRPSAPARAKVKGDAAPPGDGCAGRPAAWPCERCGCGCCCCECDCWGCGLSPAEDSSIGLSSCSGSSLPSISATGRKINS